MYLEQMTGKIARKKKRVVRVVKEVSNNVCHSLVKESTGGSGSS
jgi:hypothetical protein